MGMEKRCGAADGRSTDFAAGIALTNKSPIVIKRQINSNRKHKDQSDLPMDYNKRGAKAAACLQLACPTV
jgi:hypothetical protein